MEKGREAATATLQRAIRKHVRGVRKGGTKQTNGADKDGSPPHQPTLTERLDGVEA